MQRRSFIRKTGLAGVLAAGAAPAIVNAQATIRWRIASSFPRSLDTIFGGAEVFAKKMGEMTGGKFQISVHAAGELMPAFGVVDGVQNATVEVAHTAPYYFFGKDPVFALGCAIPFGLNARQMTAWMYEGNGLKLMREFYAKYNIVNFPGGNTGAQMGGWFRKEIKSVADIKGLKFRIGGFGGKVIERIGGVPQNIPGRRDLPGAREGHDRRGRVGRPVRRPEARLQQGRAELLLPRLVGRRPAARLLHQQQGLGRRCRPSTRRWSRRAAAHAHVDMLAKYDYRNPAALKTLVGPGHQAVPLPEGHDGAVRSRRPATSTPS